MGKVAQLTIVMVAFDEAIAAQASEIIHRQEATIPEGVSVVVGLAVSSEGTDGMASIIFTPI